MFSTATFDVESNVCGWRNALSAKYMNLPDVQKYICLLLVTNPKKKKKEKGESKKRKTARKEYSG